MRDAMLQVQERLQGLLEGERMKYEEVMEQKKGFKVERVNIKEETMTITVSSDWLETVSVAVEKQIPQKARYLQPLTVDTVVGGLKFKKGTSIITECSSCRTWIRKNDKYCNECGQKLDWRDDND